MRKAEAKKIVQQSARSADDDKDRETWRDLEIAARRMKLVKAGLWDIAVTHGNWADDLMGPDYQPPH